MWFTRVSISHPVFAVMMMLAFVVLGLFSYNKLSVEQFPDINFPVVIVSTEYPGASPEVVESDVTRRVEEQVNTISGINQLSSRSYEGASVVIIQFDLTVDPSKAAQDVREKIAIVKAAFKKEVKEPVVSRFNPDDSPIMALALQSEQRSPRELTTMADQLVKRRLENVRGVGRVTLVGGVKREVQVYLKPAQMESLKVSVDQVLNALRSENQELPAGTLVNRDTERVVQIKARLKSVTDFERIIVARRGGQPIYLSQVAGIVDGAEERETAGYLNGKRALAIDIVKAQGENTISVVDGVNRVTQELKKQLPPDVQIAVVRDASRSIRNSVASVQRNLIEGAVLTIGIVFLFLSSWRSTVITGLTLPISLIGTFLVMYVMGFSINLITLLALSICVGLLIDDAIVVRENIVRHQAMGKHHRQASLDGTTEIGLAVIATTLTIVAVFLPIGFMGGIIGRFFRQFGITVAFAVMLSMLVSFTLDPMLSSVWRDPDAQGARGKGPIARFLRAFQRLMTRLEQGYKRLLAWGLKHPGLTMLLAATTLAAAIGLMRFVQTEFVPQPDNNELYMTFYTPVGSSLELTEQKALQVEKVLREFPGVIQTYITVNTGISQGKNYATVFASLVPRTQRPMSLQQMRQPVRERVSQIAGVTITDLGNLSTVGSGKPIQLSVQGPDQQVLDGIAAQVIQKITALPGLVDLDTSSKPAKPTISIEPMRAIASDLGISTTQISAALRPLLAGEAATTWKAPDDENYDVKVRLERADRNSLGDLNRMTLTSTQLDPDGAPRIVALRQVATVTETLGAAQINRKNLTREVLISANANGVAPGTIGTQAQAAIKDLPLPPGYSVTTGGATKDMQESFSFAIQALGLGIVFIYMILASQFGSFTQPLAIMASLPLSLVGVVVALLAWRSSLNMFSIIGFIMLMGLVTKNAILLVDYANQRRLAGMNRTDALLSAAEVRLRPILMTTLAMVFGMVPLAIGVGEGSEQRAPLAHAVIGGVIASTLLTLLVVPVLYGLIDSATSAIRRKMGQPSRFDAKSQELSNTE
jgi:hydrophobic/amphiphilic exporter-1 (mainly G- bacteria), HAE1 family